MLSWVEHKKSFITSGPGLRWLLTKINIILYKYWRSKKTLIRLLRCSGWSLTSLFAYDMRSFPELSWHNLILRRIDTPSKETTLSNYSCLPFENRSTLKRTNLHWSNFIPFRVAQFSENWFKTPIVFLLAVPRRFLLAIPRRFLLAVSRRFPLTVPRRLLCCSSSMLMRRWFHMWDLFCITKTRLYYFDPLKAHSYIVKLRFTLFFLISAQKHRLWVLVRTASSRRF